MGKMGKQVHVRFGRGNDEALVWMYEKRRKELEEFDSRRRLTFNEFINDLVRVWIGSNDLVLVEDMEGLRDEYISFLVGNASEEVDEDDWE